MQRRRHHKELFRLIAQVQSPEEAAFLLEDLLTPAELEAMSERWQIVRRLMAGQPQRLVQKALGVSIATVTRGSRVLKYGRGAFRKFKERIFHD